MKKLILLVSSTTSTAETLCNNSIFTTPSQWGAGSGDWFSQYVDTGLTMPPTPVAAPVDMNGTCLFYAKKKEVCCSDTTLSQIAGTVATAKVAISDAVAILKDEKKFANQIIGLVGPAIDTLCPTTSNPFLPKEMCHKLTGTVELYTQRLVDDATRIATDQATCADALITYAGGLACMACEVEFSKYVDLENMVINMAEDTCDQVYGSCVQTIQSDVQQLFTTVNDFLADLLDDISGCGEVCKGFLPKITLEDMCGGTIKSPGDCRHYVCYEMLDGLASDAWLDWSNILTSLHTRRTLQSTFLEELAGEDVTQEEQRVTLFQRFLRELPTDTMESMSSARGPRKDGAPASHSTYMKGGYDPYDIGCQDTKTCDGFPILAVTMIGVALVGAMAAGLLVVRRRKQFAAAAGGGGGGAQSSAGGVGSGGYGTLP